MTRETVTMSQDVFDNLLEYSLSMPTGQVVGKKWKRRIRGGTGEDFLLGEYVVSDKPGYIGIKWRTIEIMEVS